jgi:hypothetical protein
MGKVLKDDHGTKNGMSAGAQERTKEAGNDPYNKAGKADGRDASNWSGSGTLKDNFNSSWKGRK